MIDIFASTDRILVVFILGTMGFGILLNYIVLKEANL